MKAVIGNVRNHVSYSKLVISLFKISLLSFFERLNGLWLLIVWNYSLHPLKFHIKH